jgi:hypothetical protein
LEGEDSDDEDGGRIRGCCTDAGANLKDLEFGSILEVLKELRSGRWAIEKAGAAEHGYEYRGGSYHPQGRKSKFRV